MEPTETKDRARTPEAEGGQEEAATLGAEPESVARDAPAEDNGAAVAAVTALEGAGEGPDRTRLDDAAEDGGSTEAPAVAEEEAGALGVEAAPGMEPGGAAPDTSAEDNEAGGVAVTAAKSAAAEDGSAEAVAVAPEEAGAPGADSAAAAAPDGVAPDREAADAAGQQELTAETLLEMAGATPAPDQSGDSLRAVIEAAIYITEEPLTLAQIATATAQPEARVREVLDALIEEYGADKHGIAIREVAGGFKMATKPEHHEAIRDFVRKLKPPLKLSLAALETLAVIAYKQPITAPEIMEIRGVQGAGVLKTLIERKLIAPAGRKNVIGKPILYKTTKDFLVQFGLRDLSELPTLKEFEELRRLALADEVVEEAPPTVENAAPEASPGAAPEAEPMPPESAVPEQPAEPGTAAGA